MGGIERRRGRARIHNKKNSWQLFPQNTKKYPGQRRYIGIDWEKVFAIISRILKGLLQIEGVKSKRRNPDD